MRLAFIVYKFPKISETFILNQIADLKENGHRVDIYADSPSLEERVHGDVEHFGLLNNVFYYRKLEFYMKASQKLWMGDLLKKFIFFIRKLSNIFLKIKKNSKNIGIFSRSRDYDVIICHFGSNGYKGLFLRDAGFISGKIATFFHGADMSKEIKKGGKHLYDKLLKETDIFLPISEFWKNKFLQFGYSPRKIIVHRMGVDCNKFRPNEIKKNKDSIIILTISRLVEKKGLRYSIEAMDKLKKGGCKIKYLIVGSGPEADRLSQIVREKNLTEIVEMIGDRDQEDVIKILKSSDIFLSPSITAKDGDMEGISVSLMEAMACGLPVVATDHSGTSELVKNEASGFLVEEKNSDLLAEKIEILMKDSKLRINMGKFGRNIVEEKYNIRRQNDGFLEVLSNMDCPAACGGKFMPQLEFQRIKNIKFFHDREEMIKVFPKNSVVAEIGVAKGDFSETILRNCNPKKFYLIDCWFPRNGEKYLKDYLSFFYGFEVRNINKVDSPEEYIAKRFSKEISKKIIFPVKGLSADELEKFEDGHFDWVYIDGGHDYKTIKKDLEISHRKVKKDGFISGHDYVLHKYNNPNVKYGVIRAVNEFCREHNYEMIYLTEEFPEGHASYAIKRI